MGQGGLDQIGPFLHIPGRGGVALPIENRLLPGSQLFRHEAQFQEGFQAVFQISVHHPVQVGEAVFFVEQIALKIPVLLINAHLVAEQAVATNVGKMAQLLHGRKLILVFLLHGQIQPAGAHAIAGEVVKLRLIARPDGDLLFNHRFPPLFPNSAQTCPGRTRKPAPWAIAPWTF